MSKGLRRKFFNGRPTRWDRPYKSMIRFKMHSNFFRVKMGRNPPPGLILLIFQSKIKIKMGRTLPPGLILVTYRNCARPALAPSFPMRLPPWGKSALRGTPPPSTLTLGCTLLLGAALSPGRHHRPFGGTPP